MPFEQRPLGAPIPNTPHAVCSSLPRLQDVVDYEEKKPETMKALWQGYPRFVRHGWVREVAGVLGRRHGLRPEGVLPVCSLEAAKRLGAFVGVETRVFEAEGFAAVSLPGDPEVLQQAHLFVQHTGMLVSSRQAEDFLVKEGLCEGVFEEEAEVDAPEVVVEAALRAACPGAGEIFLTRSGMSAAFAALNAAARVQLAKGRGTWVQLGWLYLDTQRVLEKLLPQGARCVKHLESYDWAGLEALIDSLGGDFAGLITEVPTNPLVKTVDLEAVTEYVRRRGGLCLYDPSLVGLVNLDVLPWSDIQVASLTKYAAWKGDVLCGVLMPNPASPACEALLEALPVCLERPYARELARLAWEIRQWEEVAHQVNANTSRLARWLEAHPAVHKLYWAYDAQSGPSYRKLTGSCAEEVPGSILTVELKQSLVSFYDACRFTKGPGFGTSFTMMCPFMHLAHYDLVSNPEGRAALRAWGIDPDLVRLSCGVEPYEAIEAELAACLQA